MGEVYKARDTRLDRTVAVKVLAQHRSSPELRQRFEREARTISQLSHPHICALHDVGREGETDFLVMEYLEGEPLSDRLAGGPLPLEQTLRYGVEIADALDKAHRQGIVHRDLKPANVMLTKEGVKLLDFGLAKAISPGRPAAEFSALATVTGNDKLTQEGTILGTLPYMSPEQIERGEADSRTDIFALGATLYEMATGKRAFSGSTQASLISAILRDEPKPVSQMLPMSPPVLDRVIGTCLAKDPDHRWQSAADVGLQLAWIARGGTDQPPSPAGRGLSSTPRWLLGLAAAGILAAAALMALYALRRPSSPPAAPIRFAVPAPAGTRFTWNRALGVFAVSPNGLRLAFVTRGADGQDFLWVRSLSEPSAVTLPGTEGAAAPFWSPDSRFIAFFAGGKLKKIDSSGGPSVTICDVPSGAPSGSWGSQHSILFAGLGDSFMSLVAEGGGAPRVVLKAEASRRERAVCWPRFLPDGRHFLYLLKSATEKQLELRLANIENDKTDPLLTNCSRAEHVPGDPSHPDSSRSGYLLYARDGSLLAQPFDSQRIRLAGDAVPVGQEIGQHALVGSAAFSASNTGVLAARGRASPARLSWIDRAGRETESVAPAAGFESVRLSSDSRRVVASRADPHTGLDDLLIGDLTRGVLTRMDLAAGDYQQPIWSPDGTRIAYDWISMSHPPQLQSLALRGSGSPEPILPPGEVQRTEDWSPDGRFVLYFAGRLSKAGSGLWVVNLEGEAKPRKLVSQTTESQAQFSPDGRWIAYCSPESGRSEVYLTSFPETGERIRVSASGGSRPRWKRDGREIYFMSGDNEMIATPVRLAAGPEIGQARPLFRIWIRQAGGTTT